MKKKYTIEEFKKMYEKAEKETIVELGEEFSKIIEKNSADSMGFETHLAFMMQNTLCLSILESKLFEEEK